MLWLIIFILDASKMSQDTVIDGDPSAAAQAFAKAYGKLSRWEDIAADERELAPAKRPMMLAVAA